MTRKNWINLITTETALQIYKTFDLDKTKYRTKFMQGRPVNQSVLIKFVRNFCRDNKIGKAQLEFRKTQNIINTMNH